MFFVFCHFYFLEHNLLNDMKEAAAAEDGCIWYLVNVSKEFMDKHFHLGSDR